MAEKFRLGLIQADSTKTIAENRSFLETQIRQAKEKGARLVILPEHADIVDFRSDQGLSEPAEAYFAAVAAKYGLYLHCGSYAEKNEAGRPYNTTLLFDPAGRQIAFYRKIHMFDVQVEGGANIRESDTVSAGDFLAVAETPLCTLGLSVCYDLRFPELYRLLALNGAQLLVVSANFTAKTGAAHWETLLRARAIENACYVAAVDQCGTNKNFRAYGHTMWIDPWGRVLGELEQEPGLLMAEFDPAEVVHARTQIPVLKNRRADVCHLDSDRVRVFHA